MQARKIDPTAGRMSSFSFRESFTLVLMRDIVGVISLHEQAKLDHKYTIFGELSILRKDILFGKLPRFGSYIDIDVDVCMCRCIDE
jgi:hypothetical protein